MLFLWLITLVLGLQTAATPPQQSRVDIQHLLSDDGAFRAVEIWESDGDQFIAIHGSGEILVQDTARPLQLLPTCKGRISTADIRGLLQFIAAARFAEFPAKSYFLSGRDWHELKLHSISIRTPDADLTRMFAVGKYHGQQQEIPQKFAEIENAIIRLKSQAITPDTRCTAAPPIWQAIRWRHNAR